MIDKWIRKYTKVAKALADDNDACYSRKIGVVIISEFNTPISFGYNGSIKGAPHNDTSQYLNHLYVDLLSIRDKEYLRNNSVQSSEDFVEKYTGCRTCPRKIFGCKSGERLELCNCAHAERNALANANNSGTCTRNAIMYCYCAVPCHDCSIQIVQAGIKKVVCLQANQDYSKSSRWLLENGNVELIEIDEQLLNT